jgi:hypothetical protein
LSPVTCTTRSVKSRYLGRIAITRWRFESTKGKDRALEQIIGAWYRSFHPFLEVFEEFLKIKNKNIYGISNK